MHEDDRNLDLRCRRRWAYRVDIEVALLFGNAKGALHDVRRKKGRRTFCSHGPKIGERFRGDDRRDARIKRRFLPRNRRAE
jgi:hypothetical protein